MLFNCSFYLSHPFLTEVFNKQCECVPRKHIGYSTRICVVQVYINEADDQPHQEQHINKGKQITYCLEHLFHLICFSYSLSCSFVLHICIPPISLPLLSTLIYNLILSANFYFVNTFSKILSIFLYKILFFSLSDASLTFPRKYTLPTNIDIK